MQERFGEMTESLRQAAAGIRIAIFDVDGVLTDGRVHYGDDGFEYKSFHTHDGHGIRMLREQGVEVAIITGRSSTVVSRRAEELGVRNLLQGRRDKGPALEEMLDRLGLPAAQAAYVGDDDVDIPAMRRVGLAVAVANASPLVREYAHYVTFARGGDGAAREVCELLLAAQGRLDTARAAWLE